MMNVTLRCTVCGKEFQAMRATAKFCSGACKLKSFRGVGPASELLKMPSIETQTHRPVIIPKKDVRWEDLYERCDGCDGSNCPAGFIPNWKRLGETKQEVIKKGKKK